jgi:hypothetical protein
MTYQTGDLTGHAWLDVVIAIMGALFAMIILADTVLQWWRSRW